MTNLSNPHEVCAVHSFNRFSIFPAYCYRAHPPVDFRFLFGRRRSPRIYPHWGAEP